MGKSARYHISIATLTPQPYNSILGEFFRYSLVVAKADVGVNGM